MNQSQMEQSVVGRGQIVEGFAARLERTFKISNEDNKNFDRNNEIHVNTYIRNNQNKLTTGNRTDINCNYNRGHDSRIQTHEILREIQSLKHKSPGVSGINKHILSHCPRNIIYILKNIYNASLFIGHFPSNFKTAKIIPIPKPDKDAASIENYRPISLLEVPGKF